MCMNLERNSSFETVNFCCVLVNFEQRDCPTQVCAEVQRRKLSVFVTRRATVSDGVGFPTPGLAQSEVKGLKTELCELSEFLPSEDPPWNTRTSV